MRHPQTKRMCAMTLITFAPQSDNYFPIHGHSMFVQQKKVYILTDKVSLGTIPGKIDQQTR